MLSVWIDSNDKTTADNRDGSGSAGVTVSVATPPTASALASVIPAHQSASIGAAAAASVAPDQQPQLFPRTNGGSGVASVHNDDIAVQEQRKKLEKDIAKNNTLKSIFREIQETMKCTFSQELANLPRVLGSCGHIIDNKCLESLDEMIFRQSCHDGISSKPQIRRKLLARKCIVCYSPIIGIGFPVLPLKEIASLVQNGGTENKSAAHKKENREDTYLAALRLAYYAQSQLAKQCISQVITKITASQWRAGVYIRFESSVSRVFFETFATTLHGKAGGVKVSVDTPQRMLAVCWMNQKQKAEATNTKKDPQFLVDVAIDGRFTITTVIPAKPEATTLPITPTKSAGTPSSATSHNATLTPATTPSTSISAAALNPTMASISAAQIALAPISSVIERTELDLTMPLPLMRIKPAIISPVEPKAPACVFDIGAAISHLTNPEVTMELAQITAQNTALVANLEKIKASLSCPICQEPTFLPKVLGSCGHITCEKCLKQIDDIASATLRASGAEASARQHLLARRCPLCRHQIVGASLPVLPLREIAAILYKHGYIQADSAVPAAQFIVPNYEKETAEQRNIAALQLACYAQSQLAIHSVADVVTKITAEQWKTGVYIEFESGVSRVFFDTFANTLQGKAGGVNVLINASQRMLTVQLVEKKKDSAEAAKTKNEPHLLINVATDGRLTIPIATPTYAVAPVPAVKASEGSAAPASSATASSSSASAAPTPAIQFTDSGPAAPSSSGGSESQGLKTPQSRPK